MFNLGRLVSLMQFVAAFSHLPNTLTEAIAHTRHCVLVNDTVPCSFWQPMGHHQAKVDAHGPCAYPRYLLDFCFA